jgi:hypothetical protein
MRRKFREVKPPEFLEGFVHSSSVVKLRLLGRDQGGLAVPTSWGTPLHHLQLLCRLTGVDVDLRAVGLLPRRGEAYSEAQWVELMSSALVAASIAAAYMCDERAQLIDASVRRDEPQIEVTFLNMTSELLSSTRQEREFGRAEEDFAEGHAKVSYVASMGVEDLDNMFRVSSLLSFFSCTASLFIRAKVHRGADQSPQQVLTATIETVSDTIEAFYFG